MEITITATPKEIAAVLLAVTQRQCPNGIDEFTRKIADEFVGHSINSLARHSEDSHTQG